MDQPNSQLNGLLVDRNQYPDDRNDGGEAHQNENPLMGIFRVLNNSAGESVILYYR
jgi:hypothetical protein